MSSYFWDNTLVMVSEARETVRDTMRDTWEKFVDRHHDGHDIPTHDREQDLER